MEDEEEEEVWWYQGANARVIWERWQQGVAKWMECTRR
jgi:hypothetical protein